MKSLRSSSTPSKPSRESPLRAFKVPLKHEAKAFFMAQFARARANASKSFDKNFAESSLFSNFSFAFSRLDQQNLERLFCLLKDLIGWKEIA